MKFLKQISFALALLIGFAAVGPTLVSATAYDEKEKETTELENNSDLTDKELLEQDVSDLINDSEIVKEVEETDSIMTDQEAENLQNEILSLDESAFAVDDETLAYMDEINPDIDVQLLIDQEDQINAELSNPGEVEALIAPVLIRAGISATVALLRAGGVRVLTVSWHLGLRMVERGISPKQVYEAVKYGKKYYDPKYSSTVYLYKGVAVAKKGDTLTTTYKSGVKKRWR